MVCGSNISVKPFQCLVHWAVIEISQDEFGRVGRHSFKYVQYPFDIICGCVNISSGVDGHQNEKKLWKFHQENKKVVGRKLAWSSLRGGPEDIYISSYCHRSC